MAAVATDLYRSVELTVGGLGYQLVDVERLGGGLMRVTIEASAGIKVEDCERVSRQLSHVFAVDDVEYQRLEVSSPGLDRVLKGANNFARFVGSEINVHLYAPSAEAGGRKRLRARLTGVVGNSGAERVRLELLPDEVTPSATAKRTRAAAAKYIAAEPAKVIEIALSDIDKARLVPELNFRPARVDGETEAEVIGTGSSADAVTSGRFESEQT